MTSMLAPEDRPATHARVMKITQSSAGGSGASSRSETPTGKAASSTPTKEAEEEERPERKVERFEDDYESSEDTSATGGTVEDDGWNVVPMKAKSRSFSHTSQHRVFC